ncbi:hypothetical protein [Micromonospora wenchangensis]|uniref:hypothetical protein n=1 Tax=Micromonospora wenchangensis TaxID=1185415 RepID=UPI0038152AF6
MSADTPSEDTARPDWVGQRAIAWVIDDAPVPVDLAWTLTVIARRCDENGKGSFQSKRTLAEKTGKSEDQASRDVRELLALGLIRLGDQTLPGKGKNNGRYKPGQWPTVYDVAMELKGPKPARKSKNPTGRKKAQPVDVELTPGMDTGGGMDAGGGMEAPGTPRMDAPSTPRMDAPQRSPSKNPSNNPSSLSARTSVTAARDDADTRERDEVTSSEDPNHDRRHHWVIEAGCPPHLAEEVVDHLEGKYGVQHIGWWKKVRNEGDLPALVQEALNNTPRCARCNGTGKTTAHDNWDRPYPADCPACTPMTEESRRAFMAQLAGHPQCDHGYDGGNLPMPGTGWMRCANCRAASGYVPVEERNQQARSSERGRGHREPAPPGYTRSPDGRLILTDTRAFNYDDWIGQPPSEVTP